MRIFRVEPDDVDGLPKIPSQPIGYDDARELLKKMGGLDSPKSWKGGMDDIEYKVTLLFISSRLKQCVLNNGTRKMLSNTTSLIISYLLSRLVA